uniref:ORF84 n=1 Tax=Malaco herpesvirus 4 TaxID=3031800 RepID=A0AA48P7Q3_9VIRU|nr:TPA_asm: ORF84 [Malaco herpesvirus 4]
MTCAIFSISSRSFVIFATPWPGTFAPSSEASKSMVSLACLFQFKNMLPTDMPISSTIRMSGFCGTHSIEFIHADTKFRSRAYMYFSPSSYLDMTECISSP